MNKVVLMGRLTKAPEIKYLQEDNKTAMARYTLVVDRKYGKDREREADFIPCVTFGKNAEFAELYLKKGTKIVISGRSGIISQLKMQNEMKLMDESWISYQQGKGNEEYQKYMEDLTDMQNHVLPYLQSFCSLEEKGVKERRAQQVAEKNESREAVPRAGVEANTAVKDAGKAERKPVAQKKAMPGKETVNP